MKQQWHTEVQSRARSCLLQTAFVRLHYSNFHWEGWPSVHHS